MYNFDYNDFKKELKFSTNIPIDRSGIPITSETTPNEIQDKYVNLVFAPKDGSNVEYYAYPSTYTYLWGEPIPETKDEPLNITTTITTLTYSGGLATAICIAEHHLQTGVKVTISGAVETDYNGTFEVDVVNSTTFTYEPTVAPTVTPATTLKNISAKFDNTGLALTDIDWGPDNEGPPRLLGKYVNPIRILPRHELMQDDIRFNVKLLSADSQFIYVTIDEVHELVIGDKIVISGASDERYNIEGEIKSVTPVTIKRQDDGETLAQETSSDEKTLEVRFLPKTFVQAQRYKNRPEANVYSNEEYRSFQIDREIYAALGLWPSNNYDVSTLVNNITDLDTRNTLSIDDENARCYISIKDFKKRYTELQEALAEKGIGIIASYYEEQMEELSEDNFVDVNKSKLNKKSKFSTAQLVGMGSERYNELFGENKSVELGFINRKIKGVCDESHTTKITDEDLTLLPRESDDVSIVSVSIKEVVKALLDKDDLNDELSDAIENIIDTMNRFDKNDRNDLIDKINYIVPGTITKGETKGDLNISIDTATTLYNIVEAITKGISNFTGSTFSGKKLTLNILNSALETVVNKIIWYERYTNESIFPDRTFVSTPAVRTFKKADKMMARVLIPVNLTPAKKKVSFWRKTVRFAKKVSNTVVGIGAVIGETAVGGVDGGAATYRYYFKRRKKTKGIRWVKVEFIGPEALGQYRVNEIPSGEKINDLTIPVTASISGNQIHLTSVEDFLSIPPLDEELKDKTVVGVTVTGILPKKYNGTFSADQVDENVISYTLNNDGEIDEDPSVDPKDKDGIRITRIIIDFDPTKTTETPEPITISFKMPNLPSNNAVRKKAFSMFGQFDQKSESEREELPEYLPIKVTDNFGNSLTVNEGSEVPSGYQIFYDSSKEISDMRKDFDIHNKVQFLLHILKSEFNDTRVKLIETTRSLEDQDKIQMGSTESNFLSWHNFGLAAKILITEQSGTELIKRNTPDFYKLMDIAETFIEGCKQGKFGAPMNVVWCEQLILGADMFVWEFLPLGVGHRDAWKFRQSAYNQQDPILANAYVNITEKKYVIDDNAPIPNTPFIRKGSVAYANAIVINENRWVHPSEIEAYNTPSDLILRDYQEFLYLVENKFNAHGTDLNGLLVTQWREENPISFNQLMMYNALTGNFAVTAALLAIDYTDYYRVLINSLSLNNSIEFVKQFLGEDEYKNIKIKIQNQQDGSYISLHNGKMTILLSDARSTHPDGSGNMWGEKQVDENSSEFGYTTADGEFIPDDGTNIPTIVSENSVIDGYDENNEPMSDTGKSAELLHILIKGNIIQETKRIQSLYENLDTKFLYDELIYSPNKDLIGTIENEFGVIKAQTLSDLERLKLIEHGFDTMPIPEIREMYKKMNVGVAGLGDTENIDIDTDPNTNRNADGSLNQSVFEKLVSNAQLTGVQRANITMEKPVIEPLQNDATIERIMKFVQNNKTNEPDIRDIL